MDHSTTPTRLDKGSRRVSAIGWFAIVYAAVDLVRLSVLLLFYGGWSMSEGWRRIHVFLILALLGELILLVAGIGVLMRREWARRTAIVAFIAMIGTCAADVLCNLAGRDLIIVLQSMGNLLWLPRPVRAGHVMSIMMNGVWAGVFVWAIRELTSVFAVAEFSPRLHGVPECVQELPPPRAPFGKRMGAMTFHALSIVLPVVVTVGIVLGVALLSIYWNKKYAYVLFLVAPFAVGFLSVSLLRAFGPRSPHLCMVVGLITGIGLTLGFLVIGLEGMICIVMALPIVLPGVLVGAIMAYLIVHRAGWIRSRTAVASLLVLMAASLLAERVVPLRVQTFVVEDSIEVDAPRQPIWSAVLSLGTLPEPSDWFLRSGVACPRSAVIEGEGAGAYRTCTLSTGKLTERIDAWDPGARLGWIGLETPPPMKEVNPFWDVSPPHLHGYYKVLHGDFLIEDLASGRSRLTRRTSYQHGLFPAFYWRLWCDYGASKVHMFVLEQTKRVAEEKARRIPVRPIDHAPPIT